MISWRNFENWKSVWWIRLETERRFRIEEEGLVENVKDNKSVSTSSSSKRFDLKIEIEDDDDNQSRSSSTLVCSRKVLRSCIKNCPHLSVERCRLWKRRKSTGKALRGDEEFRKDQERHKETCDRKGRTHEKCVWEEGTDGTRQEDSCREASSCCWESRQAH